jgi:LysM repeat protein
MLKNSTKPNGILIGLFVHLMMLMPACAASPLENEIPTPSPFPLTPFLTTTPPSFAPNAEDTNQEQQSNTENALPSITPVLYTIQSGDTLSVVAFRHNISLAELLAANPGVDPNLLIVGNEILIPSGDGQISGLPTPTPVLVDVGRPLCYATADTSTWCLVMVTNQQAQSVENISVMLGIYASEGGLIAQQIAVSPLNLLPSGKSIVLAALFPTILEDNYYAQAELMTSIPVANDNQRYIDTVIDIQNIEVGILSAQVNGTVSIPANENAESASLIWLVAMAFDISGNPVGLRKYQHAGEIQPGDTINFYFSVYSNGPEISEIVLLGEARP